MLAGLYSRSLVPTQLWRLLVNRSFRFPESAVFLAARLSPVELTEQAREQEFGALRLWSD